MKIANGLANGLQKGVLINLIPAFKEITKILWLIFPWEIVLPIKKIQSYSDKYSTVCTAFHFSTL